MESITNQIAKTMRSELHKVNKLGSLVRRGYWTQCRKKSRRKRDMQCGKTEKAAAERINGKQMGQEEKKGDSKWVWVQSIEDLYLPATACGVKPP